jgi:predicted nucleic acid-binding protein
MASESGPIFVDTSFLLALANTRDQWHAHAARWERQLAAQRRPLLTTDYVLVELADGLAAVRFRAQASSIIAALRASQSVTIIGATPQLLDAALDLFAARTDKDWGLTDCTSFVVMRERRIATALTTDGHFRQAGFHAPLLND